MRALICNNIGTPNELSIGTLPEPLPNSDEVQIAVHACGLNFPDLLLVSGRYQIQPPMPFAPGGEVSGVVTKLGAKVAGVSVGDRVAVMVPFGGLAERLVVRADLIQPMPAAMDFGTGSAILVAHGTALHALRDRGHLAEGQTLLVLGSSGGVGRAAVELGVALGARVIACASSEEKLQVAAQAGATELVNYQTDDLRARLRQIGGSQGIDVVFDPVGGNLTEPALRSLAWNGRHLVIGFASGDIPRLPTNLPLLKGASLVGVFFGALADHEPALFRSVSQDVMNLWQSGLVVPMISKRYGLENAATALAAFAERSVVGKVVVDVQGGNQ